MSNLDFTGVIEEHNEVHHRQRLMELPVLVFYLKKRELFLLLHLLLQNLDCLPSDFDLELGNTFQQAPAPQQRVNSVIRALPVPQQHQHFHHPLPRGHQYPEDRTKGDLIAEKLKLLASARPEETSVFKKDQDQEQDLLNLLGEQELMLQPQAEKNMSNYMWEVKEEEMSHS